MADYTIHLDELAVAARVGIHPHEAAPQRMLVSVALTVRYPAPIDDDRIEAVLDYDFVRQGVLALAAERSFALQETLCEAIAALCLSDERVVSVRVATTKRDVYPDARVGCEIVRTR